jgi:hypothetical protein
VTILDEVAALRYINRVPIRGAVCDKCEYVEHQLPAEQVVSYCRVHETICGHCKTGVLHAVPQPAAAKAGA